MDIQTVVQPIADLIWNCEKFNMEEREDGNPATDNRSMVQHRCSFWIEQTSFRTCKNVVWVREKSLSTLIFNGTLEQFLL